MSLILCMILALASLSTTPAIVGTIVDEHGKPVSGVPIVILSLPNNQVMEKTRSGSDGSFSFAGVASGGYGLRAKIDSACAFSDAIHVENGFTSIVHLRLVNGLCQNPIGTI